MVKCHSGSVIIPVCPLNIFTAINVVTMMTLHSSISYHIILLHNYDRYDQDNNNNRYIDNVQYSTLRIIRFCNYFFTHTS